MTVLGANVQGNFSQGGGGGRCVYVGGECSETVLLNTVLPARYRVHQYTVTKGELNIENLYSPE